MFINIQGGNYEAHRPGYTDEAVKEVISMATDSIKSLGGKLFYKKSSFRLCVSKYALDNSGKFTLNNFLTVYNNVRICT